MNKSKIEAEREAQVILNYFNTGDFITAETKCRKLIKKFPEFLAIYNVLGLSLQSQKKIRSSNQILQNWNTNESKFFCSHK